MNEKKKIKRIILFYMHLIKNNIEMVIIINIYVNMKIN